MFDVVSAIGQALSILVLLVGVYLVVAEMIVTAKSPDKDKQ